MPNCQIGIKCEILDPKNHENDILHVSIGQTIEKRIFKMTNGGHFGFLPITSYAHTFERDTLLFYYLTFKEDKTTEKPTFALYSHGSAPYDPTVYSYRKSNKGGGSVTTPLDSEHAECEGVSNTITQLRFLVFCFSVTSLLGQWGQICFAVYLKIVNKFFT